MSRGEAATEASRTVVASAPGKVNLSLRVGGVDSRGYHALATVFQAVNVLETVSATLTDAQKPEASNTDAGALDRSADSGAITLTMDLRVPGHVPSDSTNLALRAAQLLRAETGRTLGAHLHITKRVPIAGGMGGGSADAAATLVVLNELWDLGLSRADLCMLGARLGADVPFAVLGGTAVGLGNGSELTAVSSPPQLHWVLCAPGGHLSTPAVFDAFDELTRNHDVPITPGVDQELLQALEVGDVNAVAGLLGNDLEAPALEMRPDLAEPLRIIREQPGIAAALLSGSGPTIAALADDGAAAEHAVNALKDRLPGTTIQAAASYPHGARIDA